MIRLFTYDAKAINVPKPGESEYKIWDAASAHTLACLFVLGIESASITESTQCQAHNTAHRTAKGACQHHTLYYD